MMRVTKVNSLGRPVYGPNAFVTTKGFVSVAMAPQVTEGETIQVQNASGENCLSERSDDTLDWINVTIIFCQVDICLFTLINEHFKELKNCYGETAGFAESYTTSGSSGFALEVWSDVQNYTPPNPNAQGAWLYWLLSFLVGASLGEETIENGAVSFQITARTKKGSNWLNGPYDVECNDPVTGTAGPLLVPVDPNEPRRRLLVDVPPPAALCGCQPLSNPGAPEATVAEAPGDPNRLTVEATPPASGGPFMVDWGDGSPAQSLPGAGLTHAYAAPAPVGLRKDYVVTIWATAAPDLKHYTKITVPFTGTAPLDLPDVTVTESGADPTGMTMSFVVDNHGNGPVTIDWGDGTATGSNAGDGVAVTSHQYTDNGIYNAVVTDSSDPALTRTVPVTVPGAGGDPLTVSVVEASPPGVPRRDVTVTWDNQGQGPVDIDFGDGTTVLLDQPESGSVDHTYTTDGTYNVEVTDANTPTRTATDDVTVPFTT